MMEDIGNRLTTIVSYLGIPGADNAGANIAGAANSGAANSSVGKSLSKEIL